ncbi:MAG: 3-hydroxyacyl-CoA dehydrogenase NAD-binding domain-containing protein [Polyangiaceae bacterium]
MSEPIRRVGVIGAGVMGSGIAAHLANAGVSVLLIDIVPPNLSDAEKKDPKARNRFSEGGLQNALKAKPAAFFHKSRAALVDTGNLRTTSTSSVSVTRSLKRHRAPRHQAPAVRAPGEGREADDGRRQQHCPAYASTTWSKAAAWGSKRTSS